MVIAVLLGVLALAAVGGCGGEDRPPPSAPPTQGSAKEQIVATANQMFESWNAGDGQQTCSYLTERGRRGMAKVAAQYAGFDGDNISESCPAAAAAIAAAASGEPIGQTVSTRDVSILGNGKAQVNSEFGTALLLRRVGGVWLVRVPFFIN